MEQAHRALPMLQEKVFTASAVTLNYLDYGPPSAGSLVMLHGGAWRWQAFLSLIPTLGQRWHVHAVDLRGNGRSGWVPGKYRLEDFAQDNAEFVARLSAPTVLVGHSIGGVIALMVAARHPDKMRALIIEDSPLRLDNYRRIIDSSREMFTRWLDLKTRAQSEQDLSLQLADTYKEYPGITSAWIMFFAGCLWKLDPTFFDVLLQDFEAFVAGYDCEDILAKIDCPVLVLRGGPRLGAAMTDEEISWLQSNFRNVKCVLIDGVGHLLHLEDHGHTAVLTEMMTFLGRL